ncbi:MFS transporter [Lentilactobacillus buchneri]|uniref:Major facilitator superfamily (MFS) profile domain-containing protein n=1 Tax=Lentilactobacillus buchneri DSM 20057 TaxID=1423728 RepID=A0A4R5NTQ6_LENBU|nr:MFS transporter [Lentilactobacillus buchneri]KRK68451.1 major facilitator superfamily protein [Lentilactobacillus buchneri DSM 20057]MCT3251814.1 MFS transporter [Lentilactobacillus buchneri]MCT3546402.1 MFS transporter [Lentilactobacillus buchneri]MCT4436991.1 MFS transporter [Lentilactobacillus buchneri]MQM71557.1 MFS transporter [Lentilactobacillus buchneri]
METKDISYYRPLAYAAGIGSMLGSGIIVGLAATISVWQSGLGLTNGQVGIISGALTFAIAFGSLFGGRIAESIGLIKVFNWINLFYAIGAGIAVFAPNYITLLIGVVITGIASGTDLPISLTVVSRDSPDAKTSAKLVSSTQIFWQAGIFISYIGAFAVLTGATGARIVFGLLVIFAIITWLWRTMSSKFKELHDEGTARYEENRKNSKEVATKSVTKILFGENKKFLYFFIAILIFYIGWNLLANTWGQFQTFMMVKANASQSLATGAGIVLNVIALVVSAVFSSIAGSKYRNTGFVIGAVIMFLAMVGMTMGGGSLIAIIVAIGFYNIGSPMAGEALYKVWTQESFPVEVRSSIQGIINGTSRVVCALFAFVTPALVLPGVIKITMWCFAGVVVVSFIAGAIMIRLQRKYGIEK